MVLVVAAEFVDCFRDNLPVVEREVGDGVVDRPERAEGDVVTLTEQPGEASVRDDDGVGHGQDPAAGVAGGVVEDAELVGSDAVEAELVVQGAGDGAGEPIALVQERAGKGPFTGGAAVDEHGESARL